MFEDRLGDCYPLVGQYMFNHRDSTMVHGTIQGYGQPRLEHAWVENPNGTIFEPATGHLMSKEEFTAWANPEKEVRYTYDAAVFEMDQSGHWGPWNFEGLDSKRLDELSDAHNLPGSPDGEGTVKDPIAVGEDLDLAVQLLAEGKHIRLDKSDDVGTLLDKLVEVVEEAKAKGETAPTYDLCLVSVPGTNLFCRETKGIPRPKMPQLGGFPRPGSRADALPRTEEGGVSVENEFLEEVRSRGIGVEERTVPAYWLKATQNQLDGPKVAKISRAMEKHGILPGTRLFVTRDGYVIDGHHRWAAMVALDARDHNLGDIMVDVEMLDMEIGEAIDLTNAFTLDIGILPAQIGANADKPVEGKPPRQVRGGYLMGDWFIERAAGNQWNIYPRSAYDPATGMASYPDIEVEGLRSLAEARQWVASQAPPMGSSTKPGLLNDLMGKYDMPLSLDRAVTLYRNLRLPGNDHGIMGSWDALEKRFGYGNVPELADILDEVVRQDRERASNPTATQNVPEGWVDMSAEPGWRSGTSVVGTPTHTYAGENGVANVTPSPASTRWTARWISNEDEQEYHPRGVAATESAHNLTLAEAQIWAEEKAGPPKFNDWVPSIKGPVGDPFTDFVLPSGWQKRADTSIRYADNTYVDFDPNKGMFRVILPAISGSISDLPKSRRIPSDFLSLDKAVKFAEKNASEEGRVGEKGLPKTSTPLPMAGANPIRLQPEHRDEPNCQKCVAAAEMRARGYSVAAAPGCGGTDANGFYTWFAHGPDDVHDVELAYQSVDRAASAVMSVHSLFGVEPGTRGSMSVSFVSGGRHIFSWEITPDQEVRFFDPQDGEEYPPGSPLWDNIYPPVQLFRTDDKEWVGPNNKVFTPMENISQDIIDRQNKALALQHRIAEAEVEATDTEQRIADLIAQMDVLQPPRDWPAVPDPPSDPVAYQRLQDEYEKLSQERMIQHDLIQSLTLQVLSILDNFSFSIGENNYAMMDDGSLLQRYVEAPNLATKVEIQEELEKRGFKFLTGGRIIHESDPTHEVEMTGTAIDALQAALMLLSSGAAGVGARIYLREALQNGRMAESQRAIAKYASDDDIRKAKEILERTPPRQRTNRMQNLLNAVNTVYRERHLEGVSSGTR